MKKETRMYYNCPIEAMYMVENFGVKFCNGVGVITPLKDIADAIKFKCVDGYFKNYKIYIPSESEHIFEPKLGDKDSDGYVCKKRFENEIYWEQKQGYNTDCKGKSNTTIRNDKPFFMPQTEEIT